MVSHTETYLKETLDTNTIIKQWPKGDIFPLYFRNFYNFYELKLLNDSYLLFEPKGKAPLLKDLVKHLKRIQEISDKLCILLLRRVTRQMRKNYIENRIPFIIEDNQMYLPFVGLDLRSAPERVKVAGERFSIATQIAYIELLYDKERVVTAGEFAKKFNYSLMTGSRALNELYDKKLVTYTVGGETGRTKMYKRIEDSNYFEMGQKFLRNPVKKIVYTKNSPRGALVAGLEALSKRSMLNPPDLPVRAISLDHFRKLEMETLTKEEITGYEKLFELQIWEYDPKLFVGQNGVDLVSLYATLQEEKDERIELALEDALSSLLFINGKLNWKIKPDSPTPHPCHLARKCLLFSQCVAIAT